MKTKPWLMAFFLASSSLTALAQRADGVYHIACMVQMNDAGGGKTTAQCTTHPRVDQIGIGGKVSFDVTTTHELMDEEGAPEVTDLVLFLDGHALPGTHPVVESETDEPLPSGASDAEEKKQDTDWVVTFRLTFPIARDLSSEKGREGWKKLLGGVGKERKEVPVSMGLINGPPLPTSYRAEFVRLDGTRLGIFIVLAAALGIGFLVVGALTGALRDKEPPPLDDAGREMNIAPTERAYSLSRLQIALWTLLVVDAYLFIWLIAGEYNTEIPRTILAILGISGATYATAAAIDKGKEQGANGKGTRVAKAEKYVIPDLFALQGGAALHRVQFGLWSLVLMVVFVVTVYDTLAMPQFDPSLLGLMGISSGAYALMKIPEKK